MIRANLSPEQLERTRQYHREYNRRRRELNPGIDREACRKWHRNNAAYVKGKQAEWKAGNRDHIQAYNANWRAENPDYFSSWRTANLDRCRSYLANYRGRKANATPLWADADKIAAIYAEATRLTAETGVPHEVDHVIPLAGKNVCGLHVETNLQVLTASANRSKGNSY